MRAQRPRSEKRRVGLALGGGSARGWAHIGILRELRALGIEPQVLGGTSVGALVGAVHVCGRLDSFEEWVRGFGRTDILGFLDVNLLEGGGVLEGKRLMEWFREALGDVRIEDLPMPFGAVATELDTGREVWFRDGPLLDALRASIALPGIFRPARLKDRWFVDGGLVNPVPVSLCRAMGAEVVIAANLTPAPTRRGLRRELDEARRPAEGTVLGRLSEELRTRASALMPDALRLKADGPGLIEVLAGSLNIMQDRITRSRMAGDPPDVVLSPRLSHIGLLEFDRGAEAIEEGRASVRRALPALADVLGGLGGGRRDP